MLVYFSMRPLLGRDYSLIQKMIASYFVRWYLSFANLFGNDLCKFPQACQWGGIIDQDSDEVDNTGWFNLTYQVVATGELYYLPTADEVSVDPSELYPPQ